MGGRVRVGARRRVHDHQAVVAAPLRAGRVGARRAGVPAARLAHVEALGRVRDRPRRCVGYGLLLRRDRRVPARPARDRRRRPSTGRRACRACSGRPKARARPPRFGSEAVVAPGTGDNMAAALALGLQPGDVAISLGTSGTVYTVSTAPTADANRRGRRIRRRDRPLPSARVHAQRHEGDRRRSRRWLGVDHAALDALALAAPAGAGGVVVVPYFDGERTPNRPTRRERSPGVRTSTTREALARAAVEGVVCGLLDGLDALTAAGVRADGSIVLVGGGAQSAAYRQVRRRSRRAGPSSCPTRPSTSPPARACRRPRCCTRADIADVAREWSLARGVTVEPNADGRPRAPFAPRYAEAGATVGQ